MWWRRGRIELPVQVNNALSLLQAYPYRLISPRPAAEGPNGRGQPIVLGPRHRRHASSAPDKSSLIPHPPGLEEDERHCLGSEGEL